MTQKRLQVDSMYAHLDADGDGVVSDQEFEMKQKLVLLEN